MTATTLAPDWRPEPMIIPEQIWCRHTRLGLEVFAHTAKGTVRHPNEDGFVLCEGESLVLGVIDEATRKTGVESREILRLAIEGIRHSSGSPNERLAAAHRAIRRRLDGIGQEKRAGASALAIELLPDGRYTWASVGDCSAILWRRQRWWRRRDIQRLNTMQRIETGQLTQALGMSSTPRSDTSAGRLGDGDMLLIGSDGVFHENFDFHAASDWIEANRKRGDATLRDLAMKILQEARLTQPHPDDMCLAIIARLA